MNKPDQEKVEMNIIFKVYKINGAKANYCRILMDGDEIFIESDCILYEKSSEIVEQLIHVYKRGFNKCKEVVRDNVDKLLENTEFK